jgi:hypothetical protein
MNAVSFMEAGVYEQGKKNMVTESEIRNALKGVQDPELFHMSRYRKAPQNFRAE